MMLLLPYLIRDHFASPARRGETTMNLLNAKFLIKVTNHAYGQTHF
jgi:hypothetical protein